MSELKQFVNTKFRRDYELMIDAYSRCKGHKPAYLNDFKRGFTKQRFDFLKLQIKHLYNKGVVPVPKPLQRPKAQVQAKAVQPPVQKPRGVDKKHIATKTELEKKKPPLATLSNSKRKREELIRSIYNYMLSYFILKREKSWLKSITGLWRSGTWRSTRSGRLLMSLSIRGLSQKN